MAVDPTMDWRNVAASIEAWVRANVDAAGGGAYAVLYPEQDADAASSSLLEWVELTLTELPVESGQSAGGGKHGYVMRVGLTLLCTQKKAGQADRRGHERIGSAVRALLAPGTAIAFADYVTNPTSPPALGSLVVSTAPTYAPRETGTIRQAVVAAQLLFAAEQ